MTPLPLLTQNVLNRQNSCAVPADKVPFLVVLAMPIIAILCAIVALEAISAVAPTGYQSQKGREQKDIGNLAKAKIPAWIGRVQAAHHNTFECCIYMLCSFYVAKELGVPKLLFAKIATLLLLLRVSYPFWYATDLDMFRTQAWLTGLYACMCSLALPGSSPTRCCPCWVRWWPRRPAVGSANPEGGGQEVETVSSWRATAHALCARTSVRHGSIV